MSCPVPVPGVPGVPGAQGAPGTDKDKKIAAAQTQITTLETHDIVCSKRCGLIDNTK